MAIMGINIDPLTPPNMRTLVYAPDVQVYIAHGDTEYDISKDIVEVQMVKCENSASTVFVTFSNKGGRWTKDVKLLPMDKITVFAKRFKWVQVFSGYLDTVPFRQLYQGVVTLKATCTLKRLLHTQWNPGLPQSARLFDQRSKAQELSGTGQLPADSGLGGILADLLTEVGGWKKSSIHIANFPLSFYAFLVKQAALTSASGEAASQAFKHLLLGDDISPGAKNYVNYNTDAGSAGPRVVGQEAYVAEIIAACDEMGMGPNTTNLNTAQYMETAMTEGQGGLASALDGATKKAWETTGEAGAALRAAAMNQDATILAVACAMAVSGLMNKANLAVPESVALGDGSFGNTGDRLGLFQMSSDPDWGNYVQKMNPRQAARMWLLHLQRINWPNTDPGQAIYQVQKSGSPALYSSFIEPAKALITPVREAKEGVASTIASNPITGALSSIAGAVGVDVASTVRSATNAATTIPTVNGVRSQLGKPVPDSEGAVMTAYEQLGTPYVWGGHERGGFDCSGLFNYCFRAIGKNIGGWTGEQVANGTPVSPANVQRGDLMFFGLPSSPEGGHVVMWLGDGTVIHAPNQGDVVKLSSAASYNPYLATAIRRYAENGGPDPAAPRTDPMLAGPGTSPQTGSTSGANGGTVIKHDEQIARNLFSYTFTVDQYLSDVAVMWGQFGGHKDFIDSQPLIQMIQAVCGASMRNFQSAPNGDFIAYYPDYFGLEGKQAVMRLEDIELKDVHINFSDDQLTTHVYIAGDHTMMGQDQSVMGWLQTAGVASVEDEWLFARLSKVGLGDLGSNLSGAALMARYGVRPYQASVPMAGKPELELLLAAQIFMEKWAAQYETRVAFTFMPELLPGMRVVVGDHNLQVYVREVHHTMSFEHGFSTEAIITAPSNPEGQNAMTVATSTATVNPTTGLLGGMGTEN